jgi:tetratricopeptide (TPR) repeat protein
LQEAVINAIVHRDYELQEPNRITVFSDRIEINSAGSLHWGVDKDKFLRGIASPKWRNQSFAYLFNKLQLAQSEGQGITTIFKTMKEEGCPPPIFEIEPENIICILPAHPRHQLIRDIQIIQDNIILGKYTEAKAKLVQILIKDSYNYRCLDLYCEVLNKMKLQKELFNFLTNKNIDLSLINTNTLVNIAETLPEDNIKSKELASQAISIALSGRMEENSVIKAVLTLKKIGEPEKVIQTINESFSKFPNLAHNPILLDKRAQSHIDLAKKCIDTAKDFRSPLKTKVRAWEKARELLHEAEKDLKLALDHAESNEKYWIERDMEFLEKMKNISRKPEKK